MKSQILFKGSGRKHI